MHRAVKRRCQERDLVAAPHRHPAFAAVWERGPQDRGPVEGGGLVGVVKGLMKTWVIEHLGRVYRGGW